MHVNGFVFLIALIAFYVIVTAASRSSTNTPKYIVLAAIVIGMLCLGSAGFYALGGMAIGFGIVYALTKLGKK